MRILLAADIRYSELPCQEPVLLPPSGCIFASLLMRISFVTSPGTILPGYKLYQLFVSALHAGGKRFLDAGRVYEALLRTVEGAIPSWNDEGIFSCISKVPSLRDSRRV